MSHPFIKISAYKAWKDKPGCKPYDTDFYTEMDRIKNGYYKAIVDKYRSIADPEEKKKYKVNELPSLSISAVCKTWRKTENVVSHTGLLTFDVDKKSNTHIEDWPALRDQIFGMSGVVASILSVSFEGVAFVVKIKPEQHKDCFFSIVDGMKQHFGINVDAGLHDIIRLRFVSDDPGAKIRYNFDEIPISEPSSEYLQNKQYFGQEQTVLMPYGEADTEHNFMEAVKKAQLLFSFGQGQKWSFLVSVAGSCNVMGMSQEFCRQQVLKTFRDQTNISNERLLKPVNDVYSLYKSQHGTFNIEIAFEKLVYRIKRHLIFKWLHEGKKPKGDEILEICEKFEADKERVQLVIDRVYSEYINEFGYKNFSKVEKVQLFLEKRYDLKFNIVTGQPEVSPLGKSLYDTVNPHEIYRQLQLSKFSYSLTDVTSLMKSSFVKPYDPILDYFRSSVYKGPIIDKLASYVITEDTEFWAKQLKKTLVRSIPCGLGIKENRIVNVLYQRKQETGKSTFIRFLSPWGPKKYYTESPIIGGNQKDTELRFSENFLYNLEELAGLTRGDINKLKADISKASIKERRSYAVFEQTAPRRCNFWGSTNEEQFLHDEENTRWLIFAVQSINWNYRTEIDINDVWAEAWKLYNDGFDFELDAADRDCREYLNQNYRYKRSEEDLIQRYFRPADKGQGIFVSATEMAMKLNNKGQGIRINSNNIGKTMKALFGVDSCQVKIGGVNTRGYWVHEELNLADGEMPRSTLNIPSSNGEMPF